ncbi:CRISPR-associated endoribonuclease Cas6 [Methanosphaera sp. WGK6]|uniref:CRISPR-associated endoribonuclease Cas6 n=1 Tax=Methanosphaera sp. WGK6 TaxID=1561964 RepID=UPI00084C49CC|nr:CRISPR-associated endoribonuclease Cas6 [Methanosphaera sp. WGK6]OED29883.1 hypothetical protein NL43_05565 [Methanosphaera sp. WGK6]
MRLILKFNPLKNSNYYEIGKYDIQGFIYNLIKDTEFKNYHNVKGFKFFNFSNIFPVTDFKQDEYKNLIISSPSSAFIKLLYYQLSHMEVFRLNKYYMEIISLKIFNKQCTGSIITGTPIALFEDNYSNKYFSFNNNSFDFFFNRLKDNAIKKYVAYTGDDFNLESDIFDSFELTREVSVRISMKDNTFIIIGSLWKTLEKELNRDNKQFYNFLLDCGLGEKNSLGFGFINNRR